MPERSSITKTTIFYFSGTGNSLKIARDIADELVDAEVISIPEIINEEVGILSERIGIVFPVYIWGIPLIVGKFLKRIKAPADKYFFAVATCGSMPGATLGQVAKILKSQGMKLSAGFSMVMPGNYIPLYGAISIDKQQKMFNKSKVKIKEIAETVRQGRESRADKSFFLFNAIFTGLIYKVSSPRIPSMDKAFWVDNKCNNCGICEKVCPVDNIRMSEGKPVWQHSCEQCLACLQWCPQEAIQYGKNTSKRKRYRNPDVDIKDFIT